jgi:hypothetical protein
LLAAFYSLKAHRPHPAGILTTPQGSFAITDPGAYQEYVWIQQHTRPMDYFFQDINYDLYFYLNLRNPAPLTVINNSGYTTLEQVSGVIQGIEQHQVRYILWSPQILDSLPAWENPSDDHLGPLRNYLHSHYTLIKVFPGDEEVWENLGEKDSPERDSREVGQRPSIPN